MKLSLLFGFIFILSLFKPIPLPQINTWCTMIRNQKVEKFRVYVKTQNETIGNNGKQNKITGNNGKQNKIIVYNRKQS